MGALPWGSARRRTLRAALACALCLPASASAAPTVTLKAGLHPEQLGAGTTIKFAFSIAYGNETPSPLTAMELRYPANLGIGTSSLGLTTCRAALLVVNGPPGCPSTSVMGYGTGLVEVPFGEGTVYEGVRLTTFMAPLRAGHLGLLFYAVAPGPIWAQIIFHGIVLPAPRPFGGDLAITIPLVPTLPEAPDAALAKFSTTLGPEHITYWEYSQGHYIPYHPRGIKLPKRCPRGGFQFAAALAFENGLHAHAHTAVPCPPAGSQRPFGVRPRGSRRTSRVAAAHQCSRGLDEFVLRLVANKVPKVRVARDSTGTFHRRRGRAGSTARRATVARPEMPLDLDLTSCDAKLARDSATTCSWKSPPHEAR